MNLLKQIVKFTRMLFERKVIPFIRRMIKRLFILSGILLFTVGMIYTEVLITRKIIEQGIWRTDYIIQCSMIMIAFWLIDLIISAILAYFCNFGEDIFAYLKDLWREAKQ